MTRPQNWVEEDRDEVVGSIIDGIVSTLTFEEMYRLAWDFHYERVIHQEWVDLWMMAEEYAPELLDRFSEGSETRTT